MNYLFGAVFFQATKVLEKLCDENEMCQDK